MKLIFKTVFLSVFSFFFILFTIGFGHVFMITIEHFDMKISADEYQTPGKEATLHGDSSLQAELEKTILKSRSKGNIKDEDIYREALELVKTNGKFHFRMLPVSDFLGYCTLCCAFTGLALLVFSRHTKRNTFQTVIGIFAGFFLWITVEFSLIISSRQLGIARRFDILDENIIGIRGEYVLLKYSWGFVLLVALYLLFQESVRCNMFLFFRRHLRLMRGSIASGRIDNYAPRVAFYYTSSIWTFYLILMLAYDENIFGVRSWFTYVFFFFCFTSTGYLFYRLIHQVSFGAKLRYSIGVALVFWSDIGILGKWWGAEGPWHAHNLVFIVLFTVALVLGISLVVYEIRSKKMTYGKEANSATIEV